MEKLKLTRAQENEFIDNRTLNLSEGQLETVRMFAGTAVDTILGEVDDGDDIRLHVSRKFAEITERNTIAGDIDYELDDIKPDIIPGANIIYGDAMNSLSYRFIHKDKIKKIDDYRAKGYFVTSDEYGMYFVYEDSGLIVDLIDTRQPFREYVDEMGRLLREDSSNVEEDYLVIAGDEDTYARLYVVADSLTTKTKNFSTASFTDGSDTNRQLYSLSDMTYDDEGKHGAPHRIQTPVYVSRKFYKLNGYEKYVGVGNDGILYNTKPYEAYIEQVEAINESIKKQIKEINPEQTIEEINMFDLEEHKNLIGALPDGSWDVVFTDDSPVEYYKQEDVSVRVVRARGSLAPEGYEGNIYYIPHNSIKEIAEEENWLKSSEIILESNNLKIKSENLVGKIEEMKTRKIVMNFMIKRRRFVFSGIMKS